MFRVYDEDKEQIGEDVSVEAVSTGIYQYDYTIPAGTVPLFYEFCGTLSGKPILARGVIEREWV